MTLEKRIPVAAGLGGGSSDAAAALSLANALLEEPLDGDALHGVAASVGADVPFFLTDGPQLGEGDGTTLSPLDLPRDYWALILLPTWGREDVDGGCVRRVRRTRRRRRIRRAPARNCSTHC